MITVQRAGDLVRAARLAAEHEGAIDKLIHDAAAGEWSVVRYVLTADQPNLAEAIAARYRAAGWDVRIEHNAKGLGGFTLYFDFPDEKVW